MSTLSLDQEDELNRLHTRILYRSVLLNYVLEDEQLMLDDRNESASDPTIEWTMREILCDVLDDITDAARESATIMARAGTRAQVAELAEKGAK